MNDTCCCAHSGVAQGAGRVQRTTATARVAAGGRQASRTAQAGIGPLALYRLHRRKGAAPRRYTPFPTRAVRNLCACAGFGSAAR